MTEQFITDLGQNRLRVFIAGKHHDVRCRTVYQMERYQEFSRQEAEQPEQKPVDAIEQMRANVDRFSRICEIALNPSPDATPWPKEKIVTSIDPDQIELLACVWLDRFFAPRKDPDPCLAPQRGGN